MNEIKIKENFNSLKEPLFNAIRKVEHKVLTVGAGALAFSSLIRDSFAVVGPIPLPHLPSTPPNGTYMTYTPDGAGLIIPLAITASIVAGFYIVYKLPDWTKKHQ